MRVIFELEYKIVTAMFPFLLQFPDQQARKWIKKQEPFQDCHDQMEQIILPPDMAKLVDEDGFHLVRRELGDHRGRQ